MLPNVLRCVTRSMGTKLMRNASFLRSQNTYLLMKCKYARWSHRRPVRIVNEDELFDSDDSENKSPQRISKRQRKLAQHQTTTPTSRKAEEAEEAGVESAEMFVNESTDEQIQWYTDATDVEGEEETYKDGLNSRKTKLARKETKGGIPTYTKIFNEDDYTITQMLTEVKSSKRKSGSRKVILEGNILIQDALKAGVIPETVLFSRTSSIQELNLPEEVKLYKVPYHTIQTWSNLTTSPGVLAIVQVPDLEDTECVDDALPLTIICDNIREPGNLGTILRTAAGVGCEKLIHLKGCVDLWDSKVLRSAMGAHFRMQIHAFQTWEDIMPILSNNSDFLLADSNIQEISDISVKDNSINNAKEEMNINDNHNVNSTDKDFTSIDITNPLLNDLSVKFKDRYFAQSRKGQRVIKEFLSQIPIVPYYDVDYTSNETVLIISGETTGISFETFNALRERNGTRINIPMCDTIDSLNTGIAFAVIVFEIKRQFLLKQKLAKLNDMQ